MKTMHKNLPKKGGFTLVELLIVVSIIAILAVIGTVIFGNVQRGARDAKRRGDLDAIAKALEVNYGRPPTSGPYAAMNDSFFSTGKTPVDPLNGISNCQSRICKYCSKSTAAECASVDATVIGSGGTPIPASDSAYLVCANLEEGTPNFICVKNQR